MVCFLLQLNKTLTVMEKTKLFKLGALVLIYGITYLCSDEISKVNPPVSSGVKTTHQVGDDSFTMTKEEKQLWLEAVRN